LDFNTGVNWLYFGSLLHRSDSPQVFVITVFFRLSLAVPLYTFLLISVLSGSPYPITSYFHRLDYFHTYHVDTDTMPSMTAQFEFGHNAAHGRSSSCSSYDSSVSDSHSEPESAHSSSSASSSSGSDRTSSHGFKKVLHKRTNTVSRP